MKQFLQLIQEDQRIIIDNTAQTMGVSNAIVEKDFWVCFMLDYLFNEFLYRDSICFKGGTSLSKVYEMIERFSEDIDLALDWRILGNDENNPYVNRSNRQQEIFNKKLNRETEILLREKWLPIIQTDLMKHLGSNFDLYVDEEEQQTLCFRYPQFFEDTTILQVIRLEVGALAESMPSQTRTVVPYIAERYPAFFEKEETTLIAVSSIRTFFEKLLILHREANRTNGNYPLRYSRHYYDVYRMIDADIKEQSLTSLDLLKSVIEFKKKFYPCKWAQYDNIYKGQIKLVPNHEAISIFSSDYVQMRTMIFGEVPSFSDIIDSISEYNQLLNEIIVQNKIG